MQAPFIVVDHVCLKFLILRQNDLGLMVSYRIILLPECHSQRDNESLLDTAEARRMGSWLSSFVGTLLVFTIVRLILLYL